MSDEWWQLTEAGVDVDNKIYEERLSSRRAHSSSVRQPVGSRRSFRSCEPKGWHKITHAVWLSSERSTVRPFTLAFGPLRVRRDPGHHCSPAATEGPRENNQCNNLEDHTPHTTPHHTTLLRVLLIAPHCWKGLHVATLVDLPPTVRVQCVPLGALLRGPHKVSSSATASIHHIHVNCVERWEATIHWLTAITYSRENKKQIQEYSYV